MRTLLKKLNIIQVHVNYKNTVKKGRGFHNAYRINPYNPLSYITLVLGFVVGIIAFGVVGFWGQLDSNSRNPFKWN